MNAAIYARYSSENQRDASIDDQIRICKEYCEAHDLTVVAEYPDAALSGLSDDRPQFQKMISDGERRAFDVLVLYALDRFSRNKYDAAIYKARLKKAGVSICYVTTPIGEGPEAVLMESLLEGMAQYYSENLSRSIRRGLTGNALRGVWTSNKVPLGYLLTETKGLKIDHSAASVVHRIFELYAAGSSCNDIAKRMNREGHRSALGKPFNSSIIINILKNKIYIGTRETCGEIIENAAEPIIEPSLFEAVRQRREATYKARAHGKGKVEFFLTTKLYCGHCGSWMVGESGTNQTGKRYNYYVCSGRKHNTCQCTKANDPKEPLERIIYSACLDALTDEHILDISEIAAAKFAAEANNGEEIRALTARLSETEKKISNILSAIEDGLYSPDLRARLADLTADRTRITEAINASSVQHPCPTKEEIAYYLASLKEGDVEDPAFRRTLINTILNSAAVYDLPDKQKRIVLAFNLTPNANTEVVKSLYSENPCGVDLLYTNYQIVNQYAVIVINARLKKHKK